MAMISISESNGVVEIGLQNPPLNLVTRDLLHDLYHALIDVAERPSARCLIVHGSGSRAFCAGSDIKEFDDLGADASERKILYEDFVLRTLGRLAIPTIAAIDGPALGGGFEIALSCDMRILRKGVSVGLPECVLGGLAGSGAVRLTRLIGPGRAKYLLFTGKPLPSEKALEWGLVEDVVEGAVIDAARDLARLIVKRGPLSNKLAKELVEKAIDESLDSALLQATMAQQKIFNSVDLLEGAKAFFEKRDPEFDGR